MINLTMSHDEWLCMIRNEKCKIGSHLSMINCHSLIFLKENKK